MTERILGGQLKMLPRHAVEDDYIAGGVILSEIDLAATIVTRTIFAHPAIAGMVTRAVNEVEFPRAVMVGDVLCCWGSIERIGKTSVTIGIDVEAHRNNDTIPITQATTVFVALDRQGNAIPIPQEIEVSPSYFSKRDKAPAKNLLPRQPVTGERIVALKKLMMPNETNVMGKIFGGQLMSYMEWAGAFIAQKACTNKNVRTCVTRFMDKIEFKQPVEVGDILSCYGSVTQIGTSSIAVHVEVEVLRAGLTIPVTSADLVFVAVDRAGRKVQALSPN